ncbi:MAG: ABC transporter permease [Candidatus Aquicultorales bacterium]
MGVSVARKNLFESPARFLMSLGGVALAMLLILALDGVFAGAIGRVTLYIDNTPSQIVVAQEGVENMHMTSSTFGEDKVSAIERTPGVKQANPILFTSDYLVSGDNRSVAFICGFPPGRPGGPWDMVEGKAEIEPGEIIIDRRVAEKYGLGVGDEITALGRSFTVGALAEDTVNIINSVAFIRFDDFERAKDLRSVVSYVFVSADPGANPARVAREIERSVGGVSAMTKAQFAENERRVISDMSVDIIRTMNFVGFLIGLAALGLSAYTVTLSKVKEYGVLKAIGARNSVLMGIVARQAAISVAFGLIAAVLLSWLLTAALALAGSSITLVVEGTSIIKVVLGSVIVALIASVIPILRIASIDPAAVFRR